MPINGLFPQVTVLMLLHFLQGSVSQSQQTLGEIEPANDLACCIDSLCVLLQTLHSLNLAPLSCKQKSNNNNNKSIF